MSTGVITTLAGDGNRKALEDNVSATSTSLFWPTDVAVDPSGNMFIAESDINRIRKVSAATGMITTIAGKGLDRLFQSRGRSASGSATEYYLYRPTGVALDASGNVYVVDPGRNAIFKITVSSGNISTVAGTTESSGYNGDDILATTATLKAPEKVAFDASGNTYISDSVNRRIRKVTASTGMISTVAGTGAAIAWPVSADAPFNSEGGLATLASLYNPTGVAVDVAGNLCFADYTLGVVRKITFNGATPSISVISPPSVKGAPSAPVASTPTLFISTAPAVRPSTSISMAPTPGASSSSSSISSSPSLSPTVRPSTSISMAPTPRASSSSSSISSSPSLSPTVRPSTSISLAPTPGASSSPSPSSSTSTSSKASVAPSSTATQSSSATHFAPTLHLKIILLSTLLILHPCRDSWTSASGI